jgi:hypothetical protein
MNYNEFDIRYDGVCLYLSMKMKASIFAKLILGVLNFLLIPIIALMIAEHIIPGAIFFGVLLVLLIRYTMWNFWGGEYLIINSKSISYKYDYGFLLTNLTTKKIGKVLNTEKISIHQYGKPEQVTVQFSTYDQDELPELVYQLAIPISDKDAESLLMGVNIIFLDKVADDYSLPPLYLN